MSDIGASYEDPVSVFIMPAPKTSPLNFSLSLPLQGVDEFKIDELSSSHSDNSVRCRSSVSGGNVSPTARTHYAAANPASSGHSRISYSPPETRAPIEHARPCGYSRATIPGITYPIPPSRPQDPYPYPYVSNTASPSSSRATATNDRIPIAYHATVQLHFLTGLTQCQEVYTRGGYGQGFDPYRAQSVPP